MAKIDLGRVMLVAQGAYNSTKAYQKLDTVSYNGSTYVCLQDNAGQAPTDVAYWSVLAMRGSDGPVGPAGKDGATGAKGDTGAMGPIGPKGDTGAPGSAGAKGDTGATGPQGPVGPNGLSAYQVASAAGYTGTETQWLASLKGAQGPQGLTGAKGDTGAQGPQGIQGPKGDTGATGPTGPPGPQGESGPKGDAGTTGPQGPKGDLGFSVAQGELNCEPPFVGYGANVTTGVAKYYRIGDLVTIIGSVKPTVEIATGKTTVMVNLPEVLQTSVEGDFICQGSGVNRWLLIVNKSLAIQRYGASGEIAIPAGAWLPFEITYLIK